MSPDCIYPSRKEEGEGSLALRSCKEWVQILAWLPERESTGGMLQMALKEKVLVEEKNPQDYRKKEEKLRNRNEKALHGELAWQTSGSWRGVLEMVQEWFYEIGNGTDPRRLWTSFGNTFCQAQHRYDKTSKTPICRFCGDSTETVWHIVSAWRKFAQRENRKGEVRITCNMTIFSDKRPK